MRGAEKAEMARGEWSRRRFLASTLAGAGALEYNEVGQLVRGDWESYVKQIAGSIITLTSSGVPSKKSIGFQFVFGNPKRVLGNWTATVSTPSRSATSGSSSASIWNGSPTLTG